MEELTFSAKTVEQALAAAAEQLNKDADSLKYEIIEESKKSLFSKANVVIRVLQNGREARARRFFEDVVRDFPLDEVEISVTEDEQAVKIELNGEQASYLIGRRGETLNALQYLAGLVVNNGEDKYQRVSLNINGYREKREETLAALAKRIASQVVKSGRSVALEPMAPYERRIIHATVQEIEHANSSSVGEEPNRKVIISSDNPRPERRDGARDGRRDGRHDGRRDSRPRRNDAPVKSENSLIKDDFLTSSSTVEGLKREKEKRDAELPLYTKIDLD